jgi:hypothetical protein
MKLQAGEEGKIVALATQNEKNVRRLSLCHQYETVNTSNLDGMVQKPRLPSLKSRRGSFIDGQLVGLLFDLGESTHHIAQNHWSINNVRSRLGISKRFIFEIDVQTFLPVIPALP